MKENKIVKYFQISINNIDVYNFVEIKFNLYAQHSFYK